MVAVSGPGGDAEQRGGPPGEQEHALVGGDRRRLADVGLRPDRLLVPGQVHRREADSVEALSPYGVPLVALHPVDAVEAHDVHDLQTEELLLQHPAGWVLVGHQRRQGVEQGAVVGECLVNPRGQRQLVVLGVGLGVTSDGAPWRSRVRTWSRTLTRACCRSGCGAVPAPG